MNYIISDIIIRIKNASLARRRKVYMPYSKITKAIVSVLIKENYLTGMAEETVEGRPVVVGDIAYDNHLPLITDVKVVSKPSLRIYKDHKEIRGRGIGVLVVSTSKGVMTGKEAAEKGLGGEVLFRIW